ncbi:MAG: hypothetical protein ACYDA6_04990 [Solirubrobacteraceae bacterium]
MERDWVKRLIWSGLLAASGALANVLAQRMAVLVWKRMFEEEPPE